MHAEMSEAAREWANELSRSGNDISITTRRLQASFQNASERAVEGGEESIPDPIKLLRRLAALESRIGQLRRDCVEVADERQEIALAVTNVQVDNVHMLRQLSETLEPSRLKSYEEAPLYNWDSLAIEVERQHECFGNGN